MKKEIFSLVGILNEIINEVGDMNNISSYDFNLIGVGDKGIFYLENNEEIEVNIQKIPEEDKQNINIAPIFNIKDNNLYNITYNIEGVDSQYKKTDYKQLVKILKTVIEIIKKLTIKYPNGSIFFIGSSHKKGDIKEDPQKNKLYKLILSQTSHSYERIGEASVNLGGAIFNLIAIQK